MPAILIEIAEWLWALLAGMRAWLPLFGKLSGWIFVIFSTFKTTAQQVLSWFGANTAEAILKGGAAMAVRVAVLVFWGVFLAVVFTGIYGLSLREVAMQNPFSGISGDIMYLVNCAFPVKFLLATVTSYIIFRFTVLQAAIIMSRSIKFLFGA